MGWSAVSERKALIASFLSKSAQVFRDDCVGSRGLAIQSMHVACMCPRPRVLRAIMALHVSTAELDECEQREHHYADIQLLARTMLPALALLAVSTSSVMQHLKRRARQTLQKLMKDEIAAFTCPEILLLIPQQLSGSIGAHLSGYSHNTKHGCTLYNNLDCLLYLRVETDYIIQLGRMCREVFVFFPVHSRFATQKSI